MILPGLRDGSRHRLDLVISPRDVGAVGTKVDDKRCMGAGGAIFFLATFLTDFRVKKSSLKA